MFTSVSLVLLKSFPITEVFSRNFFVTCLTTDAVKRRAVEKNVENIAVTCGMFKGMRALH